MARSLSGGGRAHWMCSRFGWTVTSALVMIGVSSWIVRASPAWAGGGGSEGTGQEQTAVSAEPERFLAEVERRLKGCHERIVALGAAVIAEIDDQTRSSKEAVNLTIGVRSAEAQYQQAKLAREIAEIAVLEYEQGIYVQDEATAKGEVRLAETELKRALDRIDLVKERLTKIKGASKGSAADLALEYAYEDRITEGELADRRARFALEVAQSKLVVLRDYTKDKTIKELKSEVEKARSEELAKKAEWTLAQSRLKRIEAAGNEAGAKEPAGGLLKILDRAFPLDEKIRAELALLQKNKEFDAVRAKAIRDLTSQLEGLIAQGEADLAATRVDRLKGAIHGAAVRYGRSNRTAWAQTGVKSDAPIPAEISGFVAGIGERVLPCHQRIARLGSLALEAIGATEPGGLDLESQTTKVQAAEASLTSAKLTREFAELQLKEYLDAVAPQEQAMHERELAEAKDDLNRAMKQRVRAIERCAKVKTLSKNSASDIEIEDRLEDGRVVSELEQQRAEIGIAQAKSKLLVLKTFTKHQRTKELKSAIERTGANELEKQIRMRQEKAKLELMRTQGQKKDLRAEDARALEWLDQAISIDGDLRGKLGRLIKNGKSDGVLQKEIADSTNQMEAVIDRAEAEHALGRFDAVKDAIRRAVGRKPRS
jgi:hypothetical protein